MGVTARRVTREEAQLYFQQRRIELGHMAEVFRSPAANDPGKPTKIGSEVELVAATRTAAGMEPMQHPWVMARVRRDLKPLGIVSEYGQHLLELTPAPQLLAGDGIARMRRGIRDNLLAVRDRLRQDDEHARVVMCGIPAFLDERHVTAAAITPMTRYRMVAEGILAGAGGRQRIDITGAPYGRDRRQERLNLELSHMGLGVSITTSQWHVADGTTMDAVDLLRAGKFSAGIQLALDPGAPILLGRILGADLREEVFAQMFDDRPPASRSRFGDEDGGYPRVFDGNDWPASVETPFRQAADLFGTLFRMPADYDPEQQFQEWLAGGPLPPLQTARNKLGEIWVPDSRAVWDNDDARVRPEKRAGSTPATLDDLMAIGTFAWGVDLWIRQHLRVWEFPNGSFDLYARGNRVLAQRDGLDAKLWFPNADGHPELMPATEIGRFLLPKVEEMLVKHRGAEAKEVERNLGILSDRLDSKMTASAFLVRSVLHYEALGASRREACDCAALDYDDNQQKSFSEPWPVHRWKIATRNEALQRLGELRRAREAQRESRGLPLIAREKIAGSGVSVSPQRGIRAQNAPADATTYTSARSRGAGRAGNG